MTELIICFVAILLSIAVTWYRIRNAADEMPESAYMDAWWFGLPM